MRPAIFFPLVLCTSLVVTAPVHARDLEALSNKLSKSAEIMKKLVIAKQVADIGMKEKDALSLVVAYKLAKNVSPEKSATLDKFLNSKPEKGKDLIKNYYQDVIYEKQNQLIERAREHAADNREMLALIGDVISEASKGAGEQVLTAELASGETASYAIVYSLDEPAAVYVEEVNGVGLLLSIKDEQGNTVCDQNIVSTDGLCHWTPSGSGKVRVILENTSDRNIDYFMMTN